MAYVPLATAADMLDGPFQNLIGDWTSTQQNNLMMRASRAVEARCKRRLSPFTITETQRAQGVDPDEYSGMAMPGDLMTTLANSQAQSFDQTSNLVRHFFLRESPPIWHDLWTYSIGEIFVTLTYGESSVIPAQQIQGPDPDTGHVWFNMGVYLPIASMIKVTYSGGYTTTPDDLLQAVLFEAARQAITQAGPQIAGGFQQKDLDMEASLLMAPYVREM